VEPCTQLINSMIVYCVGDCTLEYTVFGVHWRTPAGCWKPLAERVDGSAACTALFYPTHEDRLPSAKNR
jgi:hypothetical protein